MATKKQEQETLDNPPVNPEQAPADLSTADATARNAREARLIDMILDLEERLAAVEGQAGDAAARTQTAEELRRAEFDAEWAALSDEHKDYAGIEQVSRRIEQGVTASNEIRLRDEATLADDPRGKARKWALRWFNFAIPGQSQKAISAGWERVPLADVQDPESFTTEAGAHEFVRRGDRGIEWLHRMPIRIFEYAKRRDQARRDGLLGSESGVRNLLANQTAGMEKARGGNDDQAGSFIASQKNFQVQITPGATERVTL